MTSYGIRTWDKRWMDMAMLVSSWSKDRSRQVGAVIVDDRNVLLGIGWNGFPRGIDDNIEERHERPVKYLWTEHAERNAIYNAAAKGIPLLGAKMYLPWYPCSDCARGIVQSGIKFLYAVEPDWKDPKYGPDFAVTKTMLEEALICVTFLYGYAAPIQAGTS